MSIIRQHRTIYCTVINIFLFFYVLLSFQRNGFAQNYWDAIFEIGFNPETRETDSTVACQQIERLIKFRNAVHERPVFDKKLDSEIREVESRISSLDAGNLYYQLPYTDRNDVWRGIGIHGGIDDDHYQLGIIDPNIDEWVDFFPRDTPELWGLQKRFGDFGLRAFIRPVTENTFRVATEGQMLIDDLNSANMIRIIEQLVNVAWLHAKDGVKPSGEFFKGSTLDDQSLKVIYGLARDFPRFFAIFNQYFTIENVVSKETNESTGPITFDIVIRINVDVFKKDYPHLGKLIVRLNGMLNYQAILFDAQNRPIGSMAFDGDNYLFSLRFRTQRGRFLALTEDSNKGKATGVDITDPGNQKFYSVYTFRLNIVGLELNIDALKINLDYAYSDNGAKVTAELQHSPEKVDTKGLILGFLPIWLIDLFIPSNIEDMTREFFQILASGNEGEGLSMMIGSIPEESLEGFLWFLTDAEVLSNGTLKFAFNLQRNMIKEQDKLFEDIRVFTQQLWKAFYLDFLGIKSLGKCGYTLNK